MQITEYVVAMVDFCVSAVVKELSDHGSECQCTPDGQVDWWPGFGYAALVGPNALDPRRFNFHCPTAHPFQPHTRLVADACQDGRLAHWHAEADELMEGGGSDVESVRSNGAE